MAEVLGEEGLGDSLRRIRVLDTLGREFSVYYTVSDTGYSLDTIRLPNGLTWTVELFQEMIDVRDETVDFLESQDSVVEDATFDLKNVVHYDHDPYGNDE